MANLVSDAELDSLRHWLSSEKSKAKSCTAGCHLNISCGSPLLPSYPAVLLRQDSSGQQCFDKTKALLTPTWQKPEYCAFVAHEWELQLRKLLAASIPVSHLDSHHHVHLLRPLFPLALDLAQRYSLPLRTRREYRSLTRASGLATPDCLVEEFFGAGALSQDRLLEMLDAAGGEVVEVMCHPGNVDNLLLERSSYQLERETERALLCDHELSSKLAELGWRLAGYRWQSSIEVT
jgi:predicted glycoside hydrolase/deacetylase ChbG (UPF0249 family)